MAELQTLPTSIPKGIPLHDIVQCIQIQGLSVTQTAKQLGCSKGNISERMKTAGIKPNGLKLYKQNRADLLAHYQLQLLKTLTPDEIKKMPPGSRMTSFGILYDKERLERGQSTENIAYDVLIKTSGKLREKRLELEAELGIGE